MSNLVYLPEGKVIYKVNIRHYNKPMWIVHKLIIKSSKNVLVAILKRWLKTQSRFNFYVLKQFFVCSVKLESTSSKINHVRSSKQK